MLKLFDYVGSVVEKLGENLIHEKKLFGKINFKESEN
jgi:hypothetical protein